MTGRSWLLGLSLTLGGILLLVLGWAALMAHGEQAGWPRLLPMRWLLPATVAVNLVNLAFLVLNLRRPSRRA